jgi:hypothetical protein
MEEFERVCEFPAIIPYVYMWNKTLNMPYWSYRAAVKRIAHKTLERTCIPVVDKNKVGSNKNRVVIPVDDDDWLSPNIQDVLLPLFDAPERQVVCWNNGCVRAVHNGLEMSSIPVQKCVMSCSYAVRASVPKAEWMEHTYVQRYRSFNRGSVFNYKDRLLSMYVRHIGAVGVVPHLSEVLFPFECSMPTCVPTQHAWAEPYMFELLKLLESLDYHPDIKRTIALV